jgi:phosphonate transport system ATP-binding protein
VAAISPAAAGEAVFDLARLNLGYGDSTVLDGLTLRIEAGERVALIGRSGVGKSTLVGALYQHRRRPAALVPQSLGLVESLSVFHNVFMGRLDRHPLWYNLTNLLHPLPRERVAVDEVLARLGLAEKAREPVGELSGGERQRTALARALFQGPTVLLADEPVSAVDEYRAASVLEVIAGGVETVVLALHDVELALEFSTRVIGLRGGAIVLDGAPDRVSRSELDELYSAA